MERASKGTNKSLSCYFHTVDGFDISQFIQYDSCCTFHHNFDLQHSSLASIVDSQGYIPVHLIPNFKKFCAKI